MRGIFDAEDFAPDDALFLCADGEFFFTAESGDGGKRADAAIAKAFPEISRNALQKIFERGLVTREGKPVAKSYRLGGGETLRFTVPPSEPVYAAPENIPLNIVYEDGDVIVVNKPRGMVVHPAPGHTGGTLVNALLYHCGALSRGNGQTFPGDAQGSAADNAGLLRPGIVHRIDKDTSGLIVAAKNDRAHHLLAAQLAERKMLREYQAVVWNNVKEDAFTIDKPVGRHPADRKKMKVFSENPAAGASPEDANKKYRSAVTHVSVLERFGKFTLIQARLETGRTHQIRVHMAGIHHPVLGDTVYGPQKQPFGLSEGGQ
ncbi:MAG: RluA family pseudouridine synthase, partial [Clostridiales bacterium]|nr:RluA family pseudouridine synthase [Clostridiales bacterium]